MVHPRLLTLAALCTAAVSASAQSGKVQGTVRFPDGSPLINAQISVLGTQIIAKTDSIGQFTLPDVPAGVLSIRFAYPGMKPRQYEGLRVAADQTVTQDAWLEAAPTIS